MQRPATLPEIHTALWQELQRATKDRHHAWRTPVLATQIAAGGADARTVVLREVDVPARQVIIYSDARAAKLEQLHTQAHATVLFWSPRLSWQLRARVQIDVATEGLRVATRWAQVQLTPSAQDYLSPWPPGQALQADGAPLPPTRQLPPDRGHFAVLTAQVLGMDWLELDRQGHRRAGFDATGQGQWLVP